MNQFNSKKRRKNKQRKILFRNLFIVALVVSAIVLVLLSPIFNVKDIQIVGNNSVSTDTIKSMLKIDDKTNIFKETSGTINQKLKENPYIEKVDVSKKLPSTLKLTIHERTVDFMLEFGGSFAYINNDGYILEVNSKEAPNKLIIRGYTTSVENIIPGNRICNEDLQNLNNVIEVVKIMNEKGLGELVSIIDIRDKSNFVLILPNKLKTVYLGDTNNLNIKLKYLKAILDKTEGLEGSIFLNRDLNKENPYFAERV